MVQGGFFLFVEDNSMDMWKFEVKMGKILLTPQQPSNLSMSLKGETLLVADMLTVLQRAAVLHCADSATTCRSATLC